MPRHAQKVLAGGTGCATPTPPRIHQVGEGLVFLRGLWRLMFGRVWLCAGLTYLQLSSGAGVGLRRGLHQQMAPRWSGNRHQGAICT